ncbi:hypothetical protein AYI69_g9230 [Smittium culicis]|uniref:Pentatricopeptide repeat-containing protein n=1 Tax=Smittium culicis TaxID=133412 RepID=A0A1R1XE63_9FUNG|nr:hypothetical protein AYI69_g9230 [Smittium culicis]
MLKSSTRRFEEKTITLTSLYQNDLSIFHSISNTESTDTNYKNQLNSLSNTSPDYLLFNLISISNKKPLNIPSLWRAYDLVTANGYHSFIPRETWVLLIKSCLYNIRFASKLKKSPQEFAHSPQYPYNQPLKFYQQDPNSAYNTKFEPVNTQLRSPDDLHSYPERIIESSISRAHSFFQGMWSCTSTVDTYPSPNSDLNFNANFINEDKKNSSFYPSAINSLMRPSINEYNIVLNCISLSTFPNLDLVLDLQNSLKTHGITPNQDTFISLIKISVLLSNWTLFDLVYDELNILSTNNIISITPSLYSQILRAFLHQGEYDTVLSISENICNKFSSNNLSQTINIELVNTLIYVYGSLGYVEKMIDVKSMASKHNIRFEPHTYSSIFFFLKLASKDILYSYKKTKSYSCYSSHHPTHILPQLPSKRTLKSLSRSLALAKIASKQYTEMIKNMILPNSAMVSNLTSILFSNLDYQDQSFLMPISVKIAQQKVYTYLLSKNSGEYLRDQLNSNMADVFAISAFFNALSAKKNLRLATSTIEIIIIPIFLPLYCLHTFKC